MPIWTGLSGSGKITIDSGIVVTVLEVDTSLTTLGPLVNFSGAGATFQRIHQAGWVGLGYDAGGGPDWIMWGQFMDYVFRVFRIYPLQVFADTLFYDLQPGCVADIEVDF